MATFVWKGATGSQVDAWGNTAAGGSTEGPNWVSQDNCWNIVTNWAERVAGGNSGNSGGGGSGNPGPFYYQAATRIPSGNYIYHDTKDDVIFEHLPNNPSDGISDGPWPKSELLYGGITGSLGTASWWHNAHNTGVTGTVDIMIEQSYWDTPITKPYTRMRFGTNLQGNNTTSPDVFYGLNLRTSSFISKSNNTTDATGDGLTHGNTRFTLSGSDTTINTLDVKGVGVYSVTTSSINNLLLNGAALNGQDYEGKSLNYTHMGNITTLCKVTCEHLDRFVWMPEYNSAVYCPTMTISPKYIYGQYSYNNCPVQILGAVGTLNLYPYLTCSGCTHDQYHISSYYQGLTYGTIKLYDYNSLHDVAYNPSTGNLVTSFSNAGAGASNDNIDTIHNIIIHGGEFRTKSLWAGLHIIDGEVQQDGILNLRHSGYNDEGGIEIAGMSGGTAGQGIFNASVNSKVLFPAGVNFACIIPSGGTVDAMLSASQTNING